MKMLSNRTLAGKKSLKRIDSKNNYNGDQWDVRSRMNGSSFTDSYSNYYSSLKLDFHRSQFDYKCSTNNDNGQQQQQQPYLYSSAVVCGTTNMDGKIINNNKKAELFSNNAAITSLYRSTPLLNYGANSYFGWHNRTACSTLPVQSSTNKPSVNEFNKFYTIEKGPSCYKNQHNNINVNNNNSNDVFNHHHNNGTTHSSSSSAVETSSSSQFGSNLLNIRKTRVKFCIVIAIFIIMVAVLVAMGVAVYSQVNNQPNLKVVRQYQGYFTVTSGPNTNFDRDVLNKDSDAFKKMAEIFTKKMDAIFRQNGLGRVYEGSDILSFRFPVAASSMEVHFVIKTKVDLLLKVQDLLSIFENGIQRNVGGAFNDVSIDLNTLTIENEQIERKTVQKQQYTTKKPLEIV